MVGGDFAEEHLLAVKMIMEKACKYLLLPGMDLTLNLNGKVRIRGILFKVAY